MTKKMCLRPICTLGLVIFALCLLLPLSAQAAEAPPCNIALSWTGDPATSITATWRDEKDSDEVMQVVKETQYVKTGFAGAAQFAAACKDISLDGSGAWHYEATASGLLPATAYVYRVGLDGAWSQPRSFVTDDPNAETLTFVYMGDVQPSSDYEGQFALWGDLAQTALRRNPELAFAVMGGDIVNNGVSLEQFDFFRGAAQDVFASVPLFSTVGNHESNFATGKAELFLDYFAAPSNGPKGFEEEFYSFDAASCHILVLNSWIFSGEQDMTSADYESVNAWIAADLAASDADWQIVVTHVPVYQVHSDTTSALVRENWEPIFEKYGVDLVFEGHQHVYSRSYPLLDGKIDYENGITYIMGVSGSKFYDSADETLAERTVYGVAAYQLVQADGDTLTVQTLDAQGNELDYVSVIKREREQVFVDVAPDAWYADAAGYVQAAGLFDGVGAGVFSPEGGMNRAMLATVLHRYAGLPAAAKTGAFSDVSAGTWYTSAVEWAAENGIVNGMGGGLFAPNAPVTMEQTVAVLYRFTGATASDSAELPETFGKISEWAGDAMRWAAETGLLDGIGGELYAGSPITRAQAAGLFLALYRL